jgi:hypothetical protein
VQSEKSRIHKTKLSRLRPNYVESTIGVGLKKQFGSVRIEDRSQVGTHRQTDNLSAFNITGIDDDDVTSKDVLAKPVEALDLVFFHSHNRSEDRVEWPSAGHLDRAKSAESSLMKDG